MALVWVLPVFSNNYNFLRGVLIVVNHAFPISSYSVAFRSYSVALVAIQLLFAAIGRYGAD
jgi:hypothetical protein